MAHTGTGFFDRKGNFFKSAREATASDLAALLGKIGDGESLAPGIANMLLHRVEALAHPQNGASLRLLRRLGFETEGTLREAGFWGGQRHDLQVLGLLTQEWLDEKKTGI